jgi:hypothetical protein
LVLRGAFYQAGQVTRLLLIACWTPAEASIEEERACSAQSEADDA